MSGSILNLFLTGNVGVGKSTAIRSFLQKANFSYGGFETKLEADRVIIRDLTSDKTEVVARREGSNWKVRREGFEGLGKSAIEHALLTKDIVVMDELGRFELGCKGFQKAVFLAISSDTNVLGVLKAESNPFLDRIRGLKEVIVIEVTEENRKFIPNLIEEKIGSTE